MQDFKTRLDRALQIFHVYEDARRAWDRCAKDAFGSDRDADLRHVCASELRETIETEQAVLQMMIEERSDA